MALTVADEPILAAEDELPLLRALAARLNGAQTATILGPDDEPIELPASAYQTLAQGDAVTLTPIAALLSPLDVAMLLDVSLSFVDKLIDSGELPTRGPEGIQRIYVADVLAFRRSRAYRLELIGQVARDAQEMGLYDLEYPVPVEDDQP